MNWKDNPNLFANGKFKIKHANFLDMPVRIEGIDGNHFIAERLQCNINYCTLIARPLSDMNDDERAQWKHFIYDDKAPRSMISRYANQTAWLLSIGVYPFDEENTEDVIWRYENN